MKSIAVLLISIAVITLAVMQRLDNGTAGAHPVIVFGAIVAVFALSAELFSFYFNNSRKKG